MVFRNTKLKWLITVAMVPKLSQVFVKKKVIVAATLKNTAEALTLECVLKLQAAK